jgi:hypothetical protein
MTRWTQKYMAWIKSLQFDSFALQATLEDHMQEIDHVNRRIERLEAKIDEAIALAPAQIQEVIAGLQALRGVAKMTAATVVTELGQLSRFDSPKQLMAYCGLVPGEHSSGSSIRKGGITKTGNAHVRRVIVEASWCYQHRPWLGGYLGQRQKRLPLDPVLVEIAWKAPHRLHKRYVRMTMKGKNKPHGGGGGKRATGLHVVPCHEGRAAAHLAASGVVFLDGTNTPRATRSGGPRRKQKHELSC